MKYHVIACTCEPGKFEPCMPNPLDWNAYVAKTAREAITKHLKWCESEGNFSEQYPNGDWYFVYDGTNIHSHEVETELEPSYIIYGPKLYTAKAD